MDLSPGTRTVPRNGPAEEKERDIGEVECIMARLLRGRRHESKVNFKFAGPSQVLSASVSPSSYLRVAIDCLTPQDHAPL